MLGTEEVQLQYAIYYLASFVPFAAAGFGGKIPYSHDPRHEEIKGAFLTLTSTL